MQLLDKESLWGGLITAAASGLGFLVRWLFTRLSEQEKRLRSEFSEEKKALRAEFAEKLAEERKLRADSAERSNAELVESSAIMRATMEALISKLKIGTTYPPYLAPSAKQQSEEPRTPLPTLSDNDPHSSGS
jgi:hypothetical protein